MSTQSPEDRELEALLARDGRLARAWREGSREEPSPALDDAVRAAARRAVHAGPRPRHATFAGRWRVPLSIAAVLVVSATLTLLVAERREHVPSADLDAPPGAPATAEAPPAQEQKLAEPHAPAKDAAPRVAAPLLRKQSTADPAQPADESRRELYDAPAEAKGTAALPETPSMQSAPAPPAPGAQPAAATVAAPSRAYEEPAEPSLNAAPSEPDARVGEHDAGMGKRGMAPPQAFPEREESRADVRAKAHPDAAEAGKRELPQGGNVAQRAAESALDPKTWIERILALRREGKLQEAERSLQAFRRRYPDYRLPPELVPTPPSAPADSR